MIVSRETMKIYGDDCFTGNNRITYLIGSLSNPDRTMFRGLPKFGVGMIEIRACYIASKPLILNKRTDSYLWRVWFVDILFI